MANRQTRVLGGNGTSVQAFTLDPGLLQYVQSVFVEVDNSGGGDINPTLTIQTNNGQALAKKQQGRSIPAGDSGTATWALRLDDESDLAGFIRYVFANVGEWLYVETTGNGGPGNVGMWLNVVGQMFRVTANALEFNTVSGGEDHYLTDTGEEFRIHDDLGTTIFSVHQNGTAFHILRGSRTFRIKDNANANLLEVTNGGNTTISLRAGTRLEVRDASNNPIFRVNENGDLQGKTGKALTFNL